MTRDRPAPPRLAAEFQDLDQLWWHSEPESMLGLSGPPLPTPRHLETSPEAARRISQEIAAGRIRVLDQRVEYTDEPVRLSVRRYPKDPRDPTGPQRPSSYEWVQAHLQADKRVALLRDPRNRVYWFAVRARTLVWILHCGLISLPEPCREPSRGLAKTLVGRGLIAKDKKLPAPREPHVVELNPYSRLLPTRDDRRVCFEFLAGTPSAHKAASRRKAFGKKPWRELRRAIHDQDDPLEALTRLFGSVESARRERLAWAQEELDLAHLEDWERGPKKPAGGRRVLRPEGLEPASFVIHGLEKLGLKRYTACVLAADFLDWFVPGKRPTPRGLWNAYRREEERFERRRRLQPRGNP